MQNTQAIAGGGGGGGGGRLFDRRAQQQHALKCPRCDSVNTKFCYYNNYNLSQPRYFCKGCRRYWTKGGVLRNVPVGGGCRKTKRSSKPKNATTTTAPPSSNSHSHSSSESSSLTAAATTTTNTTVTAAGSSGEAASASRYFLDPPSEGQIFTEMGTFTSLMTSSSNDPAVPDISGAGDGELKIEEQISCGGFLDQATHVGLDWQISDDGGGDEQGLFDFTGAVDQTYWGQNQWSDHDHDHSLNFPPLV